MLNSKIPAVPVAQQWQTYQENTRLISPANKSKLEIIIIGTGLAGASAAATLAEQGYRVKAFCFQDSPRRAHSIAAQGGINAAKNYQNDGDSVRRLFIDTIKGGDYRSREANVYRLATISSQIIDHCVAQGVPFAREYGGMLSNRSFGGTQVQRTFYAAGQTGQQLLLGAYQALERQVALGKIVMYTRHEMLDIVQIDGKARGIIARNLVTGELERHFGHAVLLCSGGYSNVFYLSTNAIGSNVSASWKAHKQGALFANPCFTQIHPTCIPVAGEYQSKLTLMSESLRNDGRIWVPKTAGDRRPAAEIPEAERDYFLERRYPAYGNLVPRDIASRAVKEVCDAGFGVGHSQRAVYLDFADALDRFGRATIQNKYGNLFAMYAQITGEDPYTVPMRIYPAVHYTMGGLWVDYELMTTIPGLYCLGEANFSEHGANRLGASALMQGLADGYFTIPATISNYLADDLNTPPISIDRPEFIQTQAAVRARLERLVDIRGKQTVTSFHRRLGQIMWADCGIVRTAAGLESAILEIQALRAEFWQDVKIPGTVDALNPELDLAQRVADFLELGELMCIDALHRQESCGCHFRAEFQTEMGEALRNDEEYAHVAAWEYLPDLRWQFHPERLKFELAQLSQRSYK
ncbi:fumarate reductase/succinate dehydrogenase flavoprotein subunit [Chamaesiphon polymorphus]|uniref:succinate dehydrogenase n=1 Tax=Chamaesiphon polymorphus CCALA 037 TaxID=2107692 RepID=A0A2T1GMC0_9CYAN|nr:fumarate reductase/succinate dehydrogenase flavoprotein subunit [Chamaesiphon polymorphus]PSB59024.1 fumarate reductase/succinate dehydrogenase flavoprotein subunit [Chamaesiphon polymorphus CCALA 037]